LGIPQKLEIIKNKVLIIAEAGVNHNGDLEKALQLIDIAAHAKADFVKFQTFKAKNLTSINAEKVKYQKENSETLESQFQMLEQLEIPEEWYPKLLLRCEERGINFLSTGFDVNSIDFLDNIGQKLYKVSSGEITHKILLRKIAQKNKPVIISTGMASINEIKDCLNVFYEEGLEKDKITVLHCTTAYPCPLEEVNLYAIKEMQQKLGLNIGYSDHTLGTEVSIAAVALGATVIEKHITIDKSLPGPDHKASIEPAELNDLVKQIRSISVAISGNGGKMPTSSELINKKQIRKSLNYASSFNKGKVLEESDLIALRPEVGINPMFIDNLIGKILNKSVKKFQIVKMKDFK
tara:strand:- start:348 stop:1397 length:1050 start_codon:yes stop_codon:yes gene_type:complete